VHRELRALAEEVARDLALPGATALPRIAASSRESAGSGSAAGLKAALLRGLGRAR